MSKENKNKEKRPFLEFLAIKGDICGDSLCGDVYLELRSKNSLLVKGCRRILGYSPGEIVLELKNDKLIINGERLVCTSYHSGGVIVEGAIERLAFDKEETK